MFRFIVFCFCLIICFKPLSQNCPTNISLKNQGAKQYQLFLDLGNLGWIQNQNNDNITISFVETITLSSCAGNLPKWNNSDSLGVNEKLKYTSCLGNFCDFLELNIIITQNNPYHVEYCKYDRRILIDECDGFTLPLNIKNFEVINEQEILFEVFDFYQNYEYVLQGSVDGYNFDDLLFFNLQNSNTKILNNNLKYLYFRIKLLSNTNEYSNIINNKFSLLMLKKIPNPIDLDVLNKYIKENVFYELYDVYGKKVINKPKNHQLYFLIYNDMRNKYLVKKIITNN